MTDASNLVTEEDYSHYTVYELKDELKERGLKVSGKKSDLISRLVSDLNSTVEAVENVIEQTEEAADAVETAADEVGDVADKIAEKERRSIRGRKCPVLFFILTCKTCDFRMFDFVVSCLKKFSFAGHFSRDTGFFLKHTGFLRYAHGQHRFYKKKLSNCPFILLFQFVSKMSG